MLWRDCSGRDFKPGCGYNESVDQLVLVQGDSPRIKSQPKNDWQYFVYNLSSTSIPYLESINLFLEPNCRKILEFQVIFDDDEYWQVQCHVLRNREGSKLTSTKSGNFSHFTRWVDRGVDFWIQFPKLEFPKKDEELRHLFKESKFSETQKKVKCRVLVNYKEEKEMTLKEILEFMKELDKGKESDIPIRFGYEELAREAREVVISNQDDFGKFLSSLYCVYRKIEIKMEKAGYLDILPDPEIPEKSSVKICSHLDKAKEEYKSMDKSDFLKMYPGLKNLFFCYVNYINYLINQGNDIDDGEYLPGTVEEIQSWLKELNIWTP